METDQGAQGRQILFLKSQVAFLGEKLHALEKSTTSPLYHLLPVRVFDLCLIDGQKKKQATYQLAVLRTCKDTRTNVIKVSRDVLRQIADSEEITIDDFVMTERLAERRLSEKRWVWRLI